MQRTSERRLILALGLLLGLFLASGAGAEVVDRIVAVVNDEVITMSELEHASKAFLMKGGMSYKSRDAQALKREMLEGLIDQKLAKVEAKRRGIEIAAKDIDQALEQFKKKNRIPDDAALNQALAQADLTLANLRQQISDQLQQERLFQAAVGGKAVVTDADVRRFYDDHVKEGGSRLHLRIIRLPYSPGATQAQKDEIEKKAEAMLKEAQKGTPLKELAQRFGVTETDMGFISQGDLDPKLGEFLSRVKPGGVAPVQTADGFQLIQLVERRAGLPPPFEEVAPEIRRMLLQQDMERRFSEWVKTLRDKAHIKIML